MCAAVDYYDAVYLRGIAEFNQGRFFESHEVWESLWRRQGGPSRQFYKGLIQAAVALHHLRRGNLRGARTLSARSLDCLGPYRPRYLGLDVDAFLAAMDRCLGDWSTGDRADRVGIGRAPTPRIRLDPPPSLPTL